MSLLGAHTQGLPGYRLERGRIRPLPRVLVIMLYGTIGLFYASSIYDHKLASILWFVKWIPLFGLLYITVNLSRKGILRLRAGGLVWGGSLFLLFSLSLNLFNTPDEEHSLVIYGSLLVMIITSQLLANLISTMEARRQFFEVVGNVGRLVIASSFLMWVAGMSLGRGLGRFSAWTDNPNTLGLMLAPTMVILLAEIIERKEKGVRRDYLILLAGFIVLMATDSRASLLWFMVSVFSLWMISRRIGVLFYIGFLLFIFVLGWWDEVVAFVIEHARRGTASTIDVGVLSGRDEVWAIALDLIPNHPLLGHGLGMSKTLIEENAMMLRVHQGAHFHNSYLTILVEAGIPALVGFLHVVMSGLSRGLKTLSYPQIRYGEEWPTAVLPWVLLVGALAHGMFETWMLSAGNANTLLFWTCVWLLFAARAGVTLGD